MPDDGMAYQFKTSAHVPKGATPEGVMAERDRIEHDYGKEKYPNLRAFGPDDEGDAMRRGIASGIRDAYRSVVIVRAEPKQKTEPRQIRVIHSVQDAAGDLVYRPIQAIRQTPGEKKWLIDQLSRDATRFADKMRDVLAEIKEAS